MFIYLEASSKKDNFDDSRISANSDIYIKRHDYDIKDQRAVSDSNMIEKNDPFTKQNLIEEETKNYIEEMKKGTYNILVFLSSLSYILRTSN